jgi:serine/threonine protein kinase
MIFEAGQPIGNVVLRHKLAEGGMASIWVADHQLLGRQVAVKLLARGALGEEESNERFELEASVGARVRSTHVPEIFEHGMTADGTPFLVMALLDGVNLKAWVEANGPLTLDEIARTVDHVAAALGAAHALGIVHRDVKPANIILTRGADASAAFSAYVIDFGIARVLRPRADEAARPVRTTVGNIGTPRYMSPEQLVSDSNIDARTDVWSLGVVTYWCLTGVLPFVAGSHRELCLAIFRGEFTPVTVLRPDLPAALDAWFDQALANDVERRFDSVAAMSRAFADAVSETGEREWTWARGGHGIPSQSVGLAGSAGVRPSLLTRSKCDTVPEFPSARRNAASVRRSRSSRRGALVCAAAGAALGAAAAYLIVARPLSDMRGLPSAGDEPNESSQSAAVTELAPKNR